MTNERTNDEQQLVVATQRVASRFSACLQGNTLLLQRFVFFPGLFSFTAPSISRRVRVAPIMAQEVTFRKRPPARTRRRKTAAATPLLLPIRIKMVVVAAAAAAVAAVVVAIHTSAPLRTTAAAFRTRGWLCAIA